MPINTAALAAAGVATSKNAMLQKLYAAVANYNVLPNPITPALRPNAIHTLDKIMKYAAVYLTSKPPQAGKAKNTARWDAMTDLANQAVTQARTLDVKLLTSPADFRQIKGDVKLGAQSYWLERVDPQHRAGFQLSAKYEQWIAEGSARWAKMTFWDYVNWDAMDQVLFLGEGAVDGDGAPIRECYRVQFDARGLAINIDNSPFTTRGYETAFAGDGWAVFVVDPFGKLYARSHQVGYFHHSTFLAGRPVAAAGEILSDDTGKIRFITAKTGHYKAGVDEMTRLVNLIPQLPPDALVLPDFVKLGQPPAGTKTAHLYRVGDFRARGVAAPYVLRPEVVAQFPGFGDTGANIQTVISRVPTA